MFRLIFRVRYIKFWKTCYPLEHCFFIFKIRFYPRLSNLDNAFASEISLTCSPFLINILDDILLVYCSDCKLTFYSLDKTEGEPGLSCIICVTVSTCLEAVLAAISCNYLDI